MKKTNIILTIVSIILFIILIILSSLSYYKIQAHLASQSFLESSLALVQENDTPTFTINRITYFSSCDANITTNSNSAFTISDLYQYTDIAIFISPTQENFTEENTLKTVVLSDIEYLLKPSVGSQNLYYKNINNFATPTISEENEIIDSIVFTATSDDEIDYSTPTLYNNCANPITLSYVNSNIKDSYSLSSSVSNISYNGSLLKTCGITLNSISCKLSFVITITNNLDETFTCPITLTIPLSTENSTIYDGSLTLKDSTSYKFIKNIQ
jgi:hypothetical protein